MAIIAAASRWVQDARTGRLVCCWFVQHGRAAVRSVRQRAAIGAAGRSLRISWGDERSSSIDGRAHCAANGSASVLAADTEPGASAKWESRQRATGAALQSAAIAREHDGEAKTSTTVVAETLSLGASHALTQFPP
jgi:hypothetical protein